MSKKKEAPEETAPPWDENNGSLNSFLAEVANGVDPAESRFPDTPDIRIWRRVLERECAEIRAKGYGIDIPNDWNIPEGPISPVQF